jgi:hypothetical protein
VGNESPAGRPILSGRFSAIQVAIGRGPILPKVQEGDARTPEGHHVIDYRNPQRSFHTFERWVTCGDRLGPFPPCGLSHFAAPALGRGSQLLRREPQAFDWKI